MKVGSYILFLAFLVPVTSVCRDRHVHCDLWHSQGACTRIPKYMQRNCKKRCGFCDIPAKSSKISTPRPPLPIPVTTECRDEYESCADWSTVSVCKINKWMQNKCIFIINKYFFRNHLVSNINEYLENQQSYEKSDSIVLKLMKFAFRYISCLFSRVAVRFPPRSSVLSEIHQLRKKVIFFSN